MTITTKQVVTKEVEIQIPSFWMNDNKSFIGILNDKTVIKFLLLNNYTSLVNGTPEEMSHIIGDLTDYVPISEGQFLATYDDALASMSLRPVLVEETLSDTLNRIIPSKEKTY